MKGPFEEIAVKEAKAFLKTVSEGLKGLAKGIESLAKQVDGFSESEMEKEDAPKATATKKTNQPVKKKTKITSPKIPRPPKKRTETASDTVLQQINRSRKGVSTTAISEKTGFDKKKVQNIVYRLKKKGKITLLDKGIYGKV